MTTTAPHLELALQHHRAGDLQKAEVLYRQILQAEPHNVDALHLLGVALGQSGRFDLAAASIQQAVALQPNFPSAHANLGNALRNLGSLDAAEASYREAIQQKPDYAEAHNDLGLILMQQGKMQPAIAHFKETLRLRPAHGETYNNLGITLKRLGQFHEAAACFREAVRVEPNQVNALCNLGNVLRDTGQAAEALDCYERVLSIHPGHVPTRWNRCLLHLMEGNLAAAWPDFELRRLTPDWVWPAGAATTFQQPLWDGSPLHGKSILVYAEGGLGETLQFVRYLPLVEARRGHVLFECQPSLLKLLAGNVGHARLIAAGTARPPFDVQICLNSLPAAFHTTLATIPAEVPYLKGSGGRRVAGGGKDQLTRHAPPATHPPPPATESTGLRPWLASPLSVGIVWHGSMSQKGDRRSVPLASFAPLARLANVRLVSLQVGPGARQLEAAPFAVSDMGSRFDPDDLEDLAAALVSLDLIVTVDTSVAHLAGAMGLPVWVVLSVFPDWRWLMKRLDSPWYPTMRLFRQQKDGDWGEVFERIAAALEKRGQDV